MVLHYLKLFETRAQHRRRVDLPSSPLITHSVEFQKREKARKLTSPLFNFLIRLHNYCFEPLWRNTITFLLLAFILAVKAFFLSLFLNELGNCIKNDNCRKS